MRTSTGVGVVACLSAGTVAVFLTNSLLGRQTPGARQGSDPKPAPAKATEQDGPRRTSLLPVRKRDPQADAEAARREFDPEFRRRQMQDLEAKLLASPGAAAEFSMRSMDLRAAGNQVDVAARVFMFDKRPDMQFRWSLRVFDARREKVIDRAYDDQIFSIEPGKLVDPTFEEVVELRPGTYSGPAPTGWRSSSTASPRASTGRGWRTRRSKRVTGCCRRSRE